MDIILKYFSNLSPLQQSQFSALNELYRHWNAQINVISRKDIDLLYTNHVLHALGIAKVMPFAPHTKVLDVGTGGGFPGIPLAILFPEIEFYLVDSIGKKIKVVQEIALALGLKNVVAHQIRAEEIKQKFHFVVSRAVTEFAAFYEWVKHSFLKESFNALPNGILYLKGGDLTNELSLFKNQTTLYNLTDYFTEPFFETKKVVYCKMK